ncbi:phosphodiester glycosidase family protein [Haloferula chungangensis]|uniref:Phosphodiester glycosidase family protein n=1 Tax=Haloferula chungangensis TaxID=1048331 RepID=A0ABW2LCW5_9BACT
MMRLLLFLLPLAIVSCSAPSPQSPSNLQAPARTESSAQVDIQKAEVAQAASPAPIQPPGPVSSPALIRTQLDGIAIDAIAFDSRTHYLAVVDQPGGPGSKWPDCRAAGQATKAIAAINAGFFTPEGTPLGKLIADGDSTGILNRASSLGAGFFVLSKGGSMELVRRERFTGGNQALQSGPFLVEHDRAVGGLSEKQSSARCFVASDGVNGWIIARTGACSLRSLAAALAGQSIGPVSLDTVLNLDGGRSSEIWASSSVSNGPYFDRPFWNKPVRNFLVLRPLGTN